MPDVRLLGPAKTQILDALREGPKTAREIAATLGAQVSAARKHLERLTELGILREEFVRAGRGRPRKYYAFTEEGMELFPRRYDAVLNGVLRSLVEERGEEYARHLLAQVAKGFAGTPGRGRGGRLTARAEDLLNGLGFAVTAERSGEKQTITSRNCPILKTAKAHRELVCIGLHAELVRLATRSERVTRGKWIVTGDAVCTHTVDA